MKRSFSGSAVTAVGLMLAGAGLYAMWWGWEIILTERGWSLFIAGSVFLSGGAITVALGRVISHLARLGAGPIVSPAPTKVAETPPPEKAPAPPRPQIKPATLEEPPPSPDYAIAEHPDFAAMIGSLQAEEPTEVDRYTAGDATYVMMSDGSVEVRSAAGRQRYPSLAALRAEAESRQG